MRPRSIRNSITPRIVYQKVEMDGYNTIDVFNILANPFTTSRPPVTLGEREQFRQFEETFTDDFLLGDLNLRYDFGEVALTSNTSYTYRVFATNVSGASSQSSNEAAVDTPIARELLSISKHGVKKHLILIDDARRENVFGLLMSLNMLIEFGDAFDYSGADFRGWCTEVGFTRFEVIHLAGPSSAAIAYK